MVQLLHPMVMNLWHQNMNYIVCLVVDLLHHMMRNLVHQNYRKITNALDFMQLTDNIIHTIQWTPITMKNYNNSDRDAMEQLCKAKDLIRRMQICDCCCT